MGLGPGDLRRDRPWSDRTDGTFTANKSLTVTADATELRSLLLTGDDRDLLFGEASSELLSRPEAKRLRFAMAEGVALITIDGQDDGRSKVTVQHSKLTTTDDVDRWKFFWTDWLQALSDVT